MPRPLPFSFPKNFTWGNGHRRGPDRGRGLHRRQSESVWDRFARRRGAVADGDTLDVACDHYHATRRTSP